MLLLVSCSHHQTITPDELSSELKAAASLAAETEAFIGYVRQNRATRKYAEGHVEYLIDEVRHSAEELHAVPTDPALAPKLQECRSQLDSLSEELRNVQANVSNPDALAANQQHVAKIIKALREANSSQ